MRTPLKGDENHRASIMCVNTTTRSRALDINGIKENLKFLSN